MHKRASLLIVPIVLASASCSSDADQPRQGEEEDSKTEEQGDMDPPFGAGGTTDPAGDGAGGATDALPVNSIPADYAGMPFSDSVYPGGPQKIPGRVQAEFYDLGGPNVAYLDHDGQNNGSGNLNPTNGTYLNEFRKDEQVDTSYTKSGGVDDHEFNLVAPEMNSLYVGWTGVGEWINLTVEVETSGRYSLSLMYACNGPGAISLSLDGQDWTGELALTNTFDGADPTDWRQFHHWNKQELAWVELTAGTHLLTVHIAKNGQMNLDYFEFAFLD